MVKRINKHNNFPTVCEFTYNMEKKNFSTAQIIFPNQKMRK